MAETAAAKRRPQGHRRCCHYCTTRQARFRCRERRRAPPREAPASRHRRWLVRTSRVLGRGRQTRYRSGATATNLFGHRERRRALREVPVSAPAPVLERVLAHVGAASDDGYHIVYHYTCL